MDGLEWEAIGDVGAALAGVLGAGLSLVGSGLYLRDIRRGSTKPHRGSWLVWSVIAVVAALSHGADGGRWSLLVLAGQALTTLAVLVAAIRCGVGWLTPANLVMLAVAALGVLGWITLTDPAAASACAAVADGTGLAALLPKTWADPASETMATYALAGATGLLCILAIQEWDPALLVFPVYFCLGNSGTAAFIGLRRRALRRTTPHRPAMTSAGLWAPGPADVAFETLNPADGFAHGVTPWASGGHGVTPWASRMRVTPHSQHQQAGVALNEARLP